MDNLYKTKQELINELKELQDAYDSLKVSINTDQPGREKTDEALLKSREMLKSIEQAAKIGGWEFDVESRVQTWTEETFRIFEIDTSHGAPDIPEGLGFIAPEYQPMALLGIQRAIEFGEPYNQEWEVITAKGNKRWINAIATPFQENGKTKSVSGSFQDITKRKQAEIALVQSEENLSTTLHSIGDGVISTDKNGLVIQMNAVAETLCGWKLTDALGKPLGEVFTIINADTHQPVADPVAKVLEKGETVGLANHTILVSKNGTEYQIADSAAPIKNKEGVITGVVLVFSDITGSYFIQMQIKENEARYRSLLNNLEAGIVVHAADTSIVMNNQRASELLGLTDDQLRGKAAIDPAWKFIHEDNTPLTLNEYPVNRIITGKKPIKNQLLGICQPGENNVVWVTVNGFPALNDIGEITEIVISFIDISGRKQSELLLQEKTEEIEAQNEEYQQINEELNQTNQELAEARKNAEINVARLKMALEVSNSGAWDWDILKNTFYWSDEFLQLFGLPENTIPGFEAWTKALHPDDIEEASTKIQEAIENHTALLNDYRIILPNNEIRWIRATGHTTYVNNKPERMIGLCMDITWQKLAEINLEQKNANIKAIIEGTKESVWAYNKNYEILFINQTFQLEFQQTFGVWLEPGVNLIESHPEPIRSLWKTRYDKVLTNEQFTVEDSVETENGMLYVHITFNPIVRNGEVIGGSCIGSNITNRKLAEQELIKAKEKAQESEEFFRTIFENSPIGKSITSLDGSLKTNKAFSDMLGYSFEEFQSKNFNDITHPDDIQKTLDAVESLLKGEESVIQFEKKYIHQNGSVVYSEVVTTLQKNRDGKPLFFITSVIDITERKHLEQIREIQYNIATAVVTSENVEHLLEFVRTQLSQLFDTTNFFAALYNADKNTLKKLHWVDEVDDFVEWDAAKSFSGYVVQTGKTLLIDKQEIAKLGVEQNIPIIGTPAECWLGVPLLVDKKAIGVLVIQSYTNTKAYDDSIAMLFEQIAHDLSIFIEKNTILQHLNVAKLQAEVNEQRLFAFMNSIPDIICYKDGEGKWLLANDADLELFCLTGVDYFGKTDLELSEYTNEIYVDAFRACMETDEKSWHKNSISKGIEVIPTVSGGKKIFEVYKIPSFYQNGARKGLAVIGRDISELYETQLNLLLAKQKAEESEAYLRSVLQSNTDVIVSRDLNNNVVFFNKAFDNVTMELFNQHAYVGMNTVNLLAADDRVFWENVLQKVKDGETHKEEYRYKTLLKTADYITLHVPVLQGSKVVGTLEITKDITLFKKREDELKLAKQKAEESDRLKSAFLANMSHEIRTPMNGILGFSELLKTPGLTGDQQQQYISIIEKSGKRMLNIINDIVDISKIEAGLVNITVSDTNITELYSFIFTFFKPEAESKNILLICKNDITAIDFSIQTDKEKVYAVLTNLVKNAIKYTLAGTIEFGYRVTAESETPEIEFYVKDTGIGIALNRQQAIFERFIQADIADKMALQGAGLGLSISKAYVEMLGGRIWVESEEGKGSAFYFTLPFNPATALKGNDEQTPVYENISDTDKKLKILIVEDDDTSEMLISLIVEKISKEIISVTTGTEAVEACRNNPDLNLILMDIKMPDMDGYEATRRIREFNNTVAIIAQTAYGLSGDKENAIAAGCNDYISKPIKQTELMELIHKHINMQGLEI